ncbi:MAG: ATP-binding protein [Nanoarchaeota archaeon]
MKYICDLFDIGNKHSIIRKKMLEQDLRLSELDVETYKIPSDYTIENFSFDAATYEREIRTAIEPVVRIAEDSGYKNNLFTALYEGVLNAFQHGNNKDSSKKVILAYKIGENQAEFSIIDEGENINPEFVSYVAWIRGGGLSRDFRNFYSFAELDKPKTNNGTGTIFMHNYVDSLKYFKSEKGGLVVHLVKKK